MSGPRHPRRSAGATLRIPAAIAVVTLVGLIAGLLGTGWYDALAWVGIGVPVVVTAYCWRRSTR